MKAKKSLIKRILNIMLSVILFILIAVIAITIVMRVSGNTPNLGGYMIFRVSSGSMEPELKIGDVITEFDGKKITTYDELNEIKNTHQIGDTVNLKINRDGQEMELSLTIGEQE